MAKILIIGDNGVEREVELLDGHKKMAHIMLDALDQTQVGKGQERHGNGRELTDQPIMTIGRATNAKWNVGQVVKKADECLRMAPTPAIRELLGCIVYSATAIELIGEGVWEMVDHEKTSTIDATMGRPEKAFEAKQAESRIHRDEQFIGIRPFHREAFVCNLVNNVMRHADSKSAPKLTHSELYDAVNKVVGELANVFEEYIDTHARDTVMQMISEMDKERGIKSVRGTIKFEIDNPFRMGEDTACDCPACRFQRGEIDESELLSEIIPGIGEVVLNNGINKGKGIIILKR